VFTDLHTHDEMVAEGFGATASLALLSHDSMTMIMMMMTMIIIVVIK